MTDVEMLDTNWAIARLEHPAEEISSDRFGRPIIYEADHNDGYGAYIALDYCNNWQDIGPLIELEKLSLLPCQDGTYQASKWVGSGLTTAYADTPTKAAALCYLKLNTQRA